MRIFAFASDGFARQTRFCLSERRFRFVKAFSPFRATISLGYRVFALKRHFRLCERHFRSVNAFSLSSRLYALAYDVFAR